MIIVGLELTIHDSGGQCANHCATKDLQLSVYLFYLKTTYMNTDKNCVNAIGTPCLSANILNTQGVPIDAKASTVRTS